MSANTATPLYLSTDMLKSYWESKLGGRQFPDELDIDSTEIEHFWDNCFMIEAMEDGGFRYNYTGEKIIEAYAEDSEGEYITEDELFPESPGIIDKLQETLETGEPVAYEGALINKNNEDVKFRKILLPLGYEGRVTHIVGAMHWSHF